MSWLGLLALVMALFAPAAAVSAREAGPCCSPPEAHAGCCDRALMTADCQALCAAMLPAREGPATAVIASHRIRFQPVSYRRRGLTHDPEDPPPR